MVFAIYCMVVGVIFGLIFRKVKGFQIVLFIGGAQLWVFAAGNFPNALGGLLFYSVGFLVVNRKQPAVRTQTR